MPRALKTTLTASGGYGRDLIDAVQMVLRDLKEVGIEAELKMQEYGAYQATTGQGKFEGMAMGPYAVGWEPDSALYGPYTPDKPRNRGHVNDPKLAAMVKEQRQMKDPEARKQLIFDIQRYAAEQQYYIYLASLHHHELLAAIYEELRPQPDLRLWQSPRRDLAGSVGQPSARSASCK